MLLGFALFAAYAGHASAGPGETCRDQAALAERAAGIPEGLLLAIGKRESGRVDPQTGGVLPWPWAVNREGEDHIFESRDDAVAYVAAAQLAGSRSIDVGCFQINLMYHPEAFASLEEAFDPAANAAYAARFLTALHDRQGSWETAVAYYHSATPWRGEPYREAVLATWRGIADSPPHLRPSSSGPVRGTLGIRIWVAGMANVALPPPRPVSAIRVGPVVPGLPRVITPSIAIRRRDG